MDMTLEFPERLWRRPVAFHNGKPRLRIAASSYREPTSYPILHDTERPADPQTDRKRWSDEPQVKVSTEAGNARVTVELDAVRREDLSLNCAEDCLTVSVRTPGGSWVKEIRLPFRVDPDTAKAIFKNGKLDLVVRKHGRFNPPGPRVDWV